MDPAQIKVWLDAAAARSDVTDDLLESGHALAAAYRLADMTNAEAAGVIRAIELTDVDVVAAGSALARLIGSRLMRVDVTAPDSPLRAGYELSRSTSQAVVMMGFEGLITLQHRRVLSLCDTAAMDVSASCVAAVACGYAMAGSIEPEIALFIIMHTAQYCPAESFEDDWTAGDVESWAVSLANAFTRVQDERASRLVLPLIIV